MPPKKPKVVEPAEPRKDGLIEVSAQWKDLGVGMTIEANGRKWTIVDSAIPAQFQYGHSLWFKFRAPRGEEVNYPPQPLVRRVTILREPGKPLPPPTLPQGHAEAELLMRELGAVEIATKDNKTGEIWCPMHTNLDFPKGDYGRGELLHLRLAHGVDTTALEALTGDERTIAIVKAHGPLHARHAEALALQNGKGFPHRHVPEELEYM